MAIRIIYDSKTIDLLLGDGGLLTDYTQDRKQARSGSGKIETINLYGIQEMSFEAYFVEARYRDLIAWWSWARQGKPWAFAKDSGNTGNTTISAPVAQGQKNIAMAATGAFSSGDSCLIRAVNDDDEYEIVVIDSITNATLLAAVENLKYSYNTPDIFRHWDYWPSVVSMDTNFNPKRNGDYFKHTFNFVENV